MGERKFVHEEDVHTLASIKHAVHSKGSSFSQSACMIIISIEGSSEKAKKISIINIEGNWNIVTFYHYNI